MPEPVTVVLVVVGTIAAASAAITQLKNLLDELGFDRSAIIEIVNATNEPLRVTVAETESGAFHQPPAGWVEPRSSMIFTAGSRGVYEGVSGHTTLEGDNFTVYVDWSNPLVGSNDIDISVVGPRAAEFGTRAVESGGGTNAHLQADLFYNDVSRMEAMLSAVPYGGWVPDAVDWQCAPAAGQTTVGLPEAYDTVRGGSERIRFDIVVTDPGGNVRTGRSGLPRKDDATGGIAMPVNECANGRVVGQWNNVCIVEFISAGSYVMSLEVPGFGEDRAALTESEGYRQVFDDGSSVAVISWRIPHI